MNTFARNRKIKPKKVRKLEPNGTIQQKPFGYITMQEFISISGMSRQSVYNMINAKMVNRYHIGKLTFLSVDELNKLILGQVVKITPEAIVANNNRTHRKPVTK